MTDSGTRRGRTGPAAAAALVLTLALTAALGHAAEAEPEFSRAPTVHRIRLYSDLDEPIAQGDDEPLSMKVTCGKCHDYAAVRQGFHFNAFDEGVPAGRPAQPWVLVDRETGSWIPVTARPWAGAFRPAEAGLSPWDFLMAFGRHLPGGGIGEERTGETIDPQARWFVAGDLEINCQACHSGAPDQDQAEWALQLRRQNLRWAATAASGLAVVEGSVRSLPDTYDPLNPDALLDDPKARPPSVKYDAASFGPTGLVLFPIPKRPEAQRCYACHTNREVGPNAPETHQIDRDVHMKAGLTCTDCHRHGLDHKIARGYERDPGLEGVPRRASLTCRGCHLGAGAADAGPAALEGRLGAPVPQHVGLPTVHFEKLSCTACHSGPYPAAQAGRVQTARIHGLGLRGKAHPDDQPPFVYEPVFLPDDAGAIRPYRATWPAFWAREADDGTLALIPPDEVSRIAGKALKPEPEQPPLASEAIVAALAALAQADPEAGAPAYVAAGKVHRAESRGTLVSEASDAAGPYAWPLAHDVRPAAQSLGSGGCSDCHTLDAPIFFGTVEVEGPADLGPTTLVMHDLQGQGPLALKAWALSFMGRPYFKIAGFAISAVLTALLLLYALMGLGAAARWLASKSPTPGRGGEA